MICPTCGQPSVAHPYRQHGLTDWFCAANCQTWTGTTYDKDTEKTA